MSTEEVNGKRVITNSVSLKKTGNSIIVTVNAPELHEWLKQWMELKAPQNTYGDPLVPPAGWPREGMMLVKKRDAGNFQLPRSMAYYANKAVMPDGQPNLSMLLHESAGVGPVTVTFGGGPFSREQAQEYLRLYKEALTSLYRDQYREYEGTATIRITL